MPNGLCTKSVPDKVEIWTSKLSQASAVHKLGSLKNWYGSILSCCEIVDSIPMSMRLIFSLLAQWPNFLRSITAFLLLAIDLTVNPSERCFPGRDLPPDHASITSAADESQNALCELINLKNFYRIKLWKIILENLEALLPLPVLFVYLEVLLEGLVEWWVFPLLVS